MNKTVYGVYDSNAEVIQAIHSLKDRGFEGDDITIVADKEETLDFTNQQAEANVNTITNVPEDESFMDKVARFFMPDDTADLSTKLANAGLPNNEAAEYVYDVERGKVLVLVNEEANHLTTDRDKFDLGKDGAGTAGRTLDMNTDAVDTKANMARGTAVNRDMNTAGSGLNNQVDGPTLGTDDTTLGRTASEAGTDTPSMNRSTDGTSLGAADLDRTRAAANTDAYSRERELPQDEKTIRLREEQLNIDKERVQAGEVVVNKEVHEDQKTINVPVEHEEVTVEHRSVSGRDADLNAGAIEDGETVRIPVVEEKLEVSKKPVVTDEIVIKKHAVQETEQVKDTLKKEDIQLESSDDALVRERNATNRKSDHL